MLNLLHANDTKGRYPDSYYYASLEGEPAAYASVQGDLQADVCIVGGGFTGLSAAISLAKHGCDVVLVDAHRVAWGASGRNGGQLGTGQRLTQPELESMLGDTAARYLWQISEDAKALALQYIADHGIDCDLRPGIVHADHKKHYLKHSQALVEHMRKRYDYEMSFLDQSALARHVNSPRYFGGIFDPGAASLNPLKYGLGLAKAASEQGARLFENSEVTQIQAGRVRVGSHSIRAKKVLFGANGYAGKLLPAVASRVMPINNYIAATEVLDDALIDAIMPQPHAVADSKFVINYFRMSPDKRMLFGGGESYGYQFPNDIASFVRKPMAQIFPQLAATKIDFAWGGTLGITVNRMPYIAEQDDILIASGFSGHGVAMATLAGRLLAEQYLGGNARFTAMAKVPTPRFPGGPSMRGPLLTAAMLFYKLRDRLGV